jgi:hypothetical protein
MSRGGARRLNPVETKRKIEWFATSSDSSALNVGDWDVKTDVLAAAVLGVLSCGDAITFGTSLDAGAISVTIYSGDSKIRKWVNDSLELDDLLALVAKRAQLESGQAPSAIKQAT